MPYKKIIKDAKNQNKLAIFIGSGVSKNSNLPDWGELIEIKQVKKRKLLEFLEKYKKYLLDNNKFFYFYAIKNNLSNVIKKEKIRDENILKISKELNNVDIKLPMNGIFSV